MAATVAGRSPEDDAKRKRGIPVVGGYSAAIPGSTPHQHSRRLDSWSGR
jgi:hypothetical protein